MRQHPGKSAIVRTLLGEGFTLTRTFRVSNQGPQEDWLRKLEPEIEALSELYEAKATEFTLLDETFQDAIRNQRSFDVRFERRD